jgi:hypothetical protein
MRTCASMHAFPYGNPVCLCPDLNIHTVSGLKGSADSSHTSNFEIVRHTAQFHRRSERFQWVDKIVNVGRNIQTCARIKYNWYVMDPKRVADGSCLSNHVSSVSSSVGSFDQINLKLCR